MSTALEWVADNYDMLERLAFSFAARRQQPASVGEDLFSNVIVDRAERIAETWVPERGGFRAHMLRSFKWYMWKELNARAAPRIPTGVLTEDTQATGEDHTVKLEVNERVLSVLERLCPYDQGLLELRHLDGYSFEEIGEQFINRSKATAFKHYQQALANAHALVAEMDDA